MRIIGRRFIVAPIALLSLALTIPASAQSQSPSEAPLASWDSGAKGGMNFAGVSFNVKGDPTKTTSRTGGVGGIFVTRQITPMIWAQGEALISVKGYKTATFRRRMTYLEIPLLARLCLPNLGRVATHAYTGPALAFKLGAFDTRDNIPEGVADDVTGFDLGWMVGAGLDFQGLIVEARFTLGFSNTDANVAPANGSVKNRSFTILAGVRFGK